MRSRNRLWPVVFLAVALGLGVGSLASTAGCTSSTDSNPAGSSGSPSGSKNFTLKGKAR